MFENIHTWFKTFKCNLMAIGVMKLSRIKKNLICKQIASNLFKSIFKKKKIK